MFGSVVGNHFGTGVEPRNCKPSEPQTEANIEREARDVDGRLTRSDACYENKSDPETDLDPAWAVPGRKLGTGSCVLPWSCRIAHVDCALARVRVLFCSRYVE